MVTPLQCPLRGPAESIWRGRQTAHTRLTSLRGLWRAWRRRLALFFAVLTHSGLFFSGAGGSCARGRKIGGPEWAEGSCRKRGKRISITEKTINNRFILKTPSWRILQYCWGSPSFLNCLKVGPIIRLCRKTQQYITCIPKQSTWLKSFLISGTCKHLRCFYMFLLLIYFLVTTNQYCSEHQKNINLIRNKK